MLTTAKYQTSAIEKRKQIENKRKDQKLIVRVKKCLITNERAKGVKIQIKKN